MATWVAVLESFVLLERNNIQDFLFLQIQFSLLRIITSEAYVRFCLNVMM